MQAQDVLNCVTANARMVGIPLDAAQAERVATHLQRTAAMAALLDAFPLHDEDEPAEIYRPAPFIQAPD
ncbi:DUF4089 domain-containing protein [Hydrogenophaga palleronii]|uniref:DUF4089 domain-containing protein n=1 Tax=Hydrogenophaga palleronii TaxID=65655 RepID=UPI000826132B|nr:DUF4089 domain-containing protein [Hydrogenophaga palleronii]